MKRRDVIKNIGFSIGAISLAPTALSILQSCQTAKTPYVLEFFSKEEFLIVKKIADAILPATDIPSASELKVPEFIDGFTANVVLPEDTILLKKALEVLVNKEEAQNEEGIKKLLDKYLKAPKEQQQEWGKEMGETQEKLKENPQLPLPEDPLLFSFFNEIRGRVVWAFKNTEFIGEEVLAYRPVPGKQIGCMDLQEATEGKAWSL